MLRMGSMAQKVTPPVRKPKPRCSPPSFSPTQALLAAKAGAIQHLLEHLLEREAQIELFLQHPAATVSQGQKKKVDALVENLEPFFASLGDDATADLKVFFYYPPASVRAVLIDDDLLAIGWYTYIQRKATLTLPNAMDVQGTYMPMVQTTLGTAEWDPLKKMFDSVYAGLKKFAVQYVPTDATPPEPATKQPST